MSLRPKKAPSTKFHKRNQNSGKISQMWKNLLGGKTALLTHALSKNQTLQCKGKDGRELINKSIKPCILPHFPSMETTPNYNKGGQEGERDSLTSDEKATN